MKKQVMASEDIPTALALVRDLVNSRQILRGNSYAREDLHTPAALDEWWQRRAGWAWPKPSGRAELDAALVAREGFRGVLAHNNDCPQPEDRDAIAALDALAATLPLRIVVSSGTPARLVPLEVGSAREAVAALLAEMIRASAGQTWQRLKVCHDPDCREAFYDTSRNGSRIWCSMEVCGSRAKQRAFIERRRGAEKKNGGMA